MVHSSALQHNQQTYGFFKFENREVRCSQQAVNPPSIGRVAQLIMALWSLSRNRIGLTTSGNSVGIKLT